MSEMYIYVRNATDVSKGRKNDGKKIKSIVIIKAGKCPKLKFFYVPLILGAGQWDNFFQWEKKDHCVVK